MKTMKLKFIILFLITMFVIMVSCSEEFLEEKPYTLFTTEYFKTPEGLRNARNAAYAGLRYNFGNNGSLAINVVGTDEWTYGDQIASANQDGGILELGKYTLTADNGHILTPWNNNWWNINLCNAIVEYAPFVKMDENEKNIIVAEARMLRALYYIILVQQFGPVPLNLGAGDLKFNTNPVKMFFRIEENLLQKNYNAIIEDLKFALEYLPDKRPENAFKLSKAVALHFLSKIYIYKGYSSVKEDDDFEYAYNYAMELINNKSKYGVDLLQDYGMVHDENNDYNKEIIFSAERIPGNDLANEFPASDNWHAKANCANNMFNNAYINVKVGGKALIDGRPLPYGRPLRRYAPTRWLFEEAFADKVNDSRFDNSFRMVWFAISVNEPGSKAYEDYVTWLNSIGFNYGDTAILLTYTDQEAQTLKAKNVKYVVFGPSEFYNNQTNTDANVYPMYPNLKKFVDTKRANFNDASGRPFKIARFAETILLAAEAAMQTGRKLEAMNLINELKKRAAYRPGLSTAEINARYDNIKLTDPDQVTLDYILDERTRELCGEQWRWPDLAMRGKLVERVQRCNPDAAANVKDYHVLRPIPRSQLDAIDDPEKSKYQNPGY